MMKHSKTIAVTIENGKCDGHFQGHPIVPAAVMVQWLLSFLCEVTQTEMHQHTCSKLKCLHELRPETNVELELMSVGNRWQASISESGKICASMVFKEQL